MSDYRYKKGTCGTRHLLLMSSGYVYFWSVSKERCLLWNVLGSVPIRVSAFWHQKTHTTYALCVWAKSTCTLFKRERSTFIVSVFLWKSSVLICPFSRENWGNHLPPAARFRPLLRQRGDWDHGDRRWSLLTILREEFISRARWRLTRSEPERWRPVI